MDGSAEQNIQTDRGSLLAAVLKHMRDPAFPNEAFDHWFEYARLIAASSPCISPEFSARTYCGRRARGLAEQNDGDC